MQSPLDLLSTTGLSGRSFTTGRGAVCLGLSQAVSAQVVVGGEDWKRASVVGEQGLGLGARQGGQPRQGRAQRLGSSAELVLEPMTLWEEPRKGAAWSPG